MSATLAYGIVTWAAIVLLYLGLAATLREVRLLRGTVLRQATSQPEIRLPQGILASGPGIVLAADSGCSLCLQVLERLAAREIPATLLTHEPAGTWAGKAGGLRVVSDVEAWRAISHLAPPVLLLLGDHGVVRGVLLPVRIEEVDSVLAGWTRNLGVASA